MYCSYNQSYRDGDSYSGSHEFHGATLTPTGEVVFAPWDTKRVGIYDPKTDTYTHGPSHEQETRAFQAPLLTQTGDIVFVPDSSADVGTFSLYAEKSVGRGAVLHPLVNNA